MMAGNLKSSPRYTIIVQWSEEDHCYVVSLPEWGPYATAYGDSYEEAARAAQEVLEVLMEDEDGQPPKFPAPALYHYPGATVKDLPADAVGPRRTEASARQTA